MTEYERKRSLYFHDCCLCGKPYHEGPCEHARSER